MTIEKLKSLVSEMNRYFTSGNPVPVEKATVPATQWRELNTVIVDLIESYPKSKGLSLSQDQKYTVNGDSIVNRATGEKIPDDEPVFILRAKDHHALKVLRFYRSIISVGEHHYSAIQEKLNDFMDFKHRYSDRLKEPDTKEYIEVIKPQKVKVASFDTDSFMKALHRAADAQGKTMKDVSNETGVSETTLSRAKDHNKAPDAASLAALSAWAGINPARYSGFNLPKRLNSADDEVSNTVLKSNQQTNAINSTKDDFIAALKSLCDETLSVPPGTAVKIPEQITNEFRKHMRGESSIIDRIINGESDPLKQSHKAECGVSCTVISELGKGFAS